MKQETLRSPEHETAAPLADGAGSLPLAQETTGSELCHIGSICQLFVCDIKCNSAVNFVADSGRESCQHARKSFSSVVTDQCHVRSMKPRQVVRGNAQCVFLECGIARYQVPQNTAVPDEDSTFLHRFGAEEVERRLREKCCAAEYIPRYKPEQKNLLSLFGDGKIPCTSFGEQEEIVGGISLVGNNRVRREMPRLGRSDHGVNFRSRQSLQKP